jgi:hypothetical protein
MASACVSICLADTIGELGIRELTNSLTITNPPIHELSGSPPGEVAQLVEHTTENRSVDSSILSLATTLRSPG